VSKVDKSRLHECLNRFIERDGQAWREETNPKTTGEMFQMLNMNQTLPRLCSLGIELARDETALGELRRSDAVVHDGGLLRTRMEEDGYLFLPGLLDADQVLQARRYVVNRLAELGLLDERFPREDAVSKPHDGGLFIPDQLARDNRVLHQLLYAGAMMGMYQRLLGGPVRHFDYTWFRSVPGGGSGTYPHCDVVYMGRGTFNLCTSWTPIGDVPLEMGGLMILENSHRQKEALRAYLQRDVDAYCTNRPDAAEIESGAKTWQDWDGRLSSNPASLREKLGGRWLTAEFKAGDVLVFGMATVHASLDNQSDRYRLSSDSRYQLATDSVDERWVGANPIAHGPAGKKGMAC